MIQNNEDLYSMISVLIGELRIAGEEQWSSALDDAMSISTVPGEILGATRLQLEKLQHTQLPRLLGLEWRIDEALSYLHRILGPSLV